MFERFERPADCIERPIYRLAIFLHWRSKRHRVLEGKPKCGISMRGILVTRSNPSDERIAGSAAGHDEYNMECQGKVLVVYVPVGLCGN